MSLADYINLNDFIVNLIMIIIIGAHSWTCHQVQASLRLLAADSLDRMTVPTMSAPRTEAISL